ncbi:MAG: diguanylate cyclase [Gemmatimonadaceae bacterium]|nr:diguanylate cyclase [Gemmatimonadaceae bacterium]
MTEASVLVLAERDRALPAWLDAWVASERHDAHCLHGIDSLLSIAMRLRPRLVVLDAREAVDAGDPATHPALVACRTIKQDSFSAVVPVLVLVTDDATFSLAFASGADEVLREHTTAAEAIARLGSMLRRSDRDTFVHPSTRLPGTHDIEAELDRRIVTGERFAACYADLDHFKEFNDRYGYHHGDGVIRLLATVLHDVVKGLCGSDGFVGHIGGDDFLFVVPVAAMPLICAEIVDTFDALIPMQYSEQDRRAGYFLGKDRRGQLHRVPLMTLSIGVVTNQRRRFLHAAHVSELATEMKSYAKTLPGSLYTVDRRRDEVLEATGGMPTPSAMTAIPPASPLPRDVIPLRSSQGGR